MSKKPQKQKKSGNISRQQAIKNIKSAKKEKAFKEQIKNAGSEFSKIKKSDVNVFYRRTQNFWVGKDPNKRNELIKKALGVDTFKEAWNKVMNDEDFKAQLDEWSEEAGGTPELIRRVQPLR